MVHQCRQPSSSKVLRVVLRSVFRFGLRLGPEICGCRNGIGPNVVAFWTSEERKVIGKLVNQ